MFGAEITRHPGGRKDEGGGQDIRGKKATQAFAIAFQEVCFHSHPHATGQGGFHLGEAVHNIYE